MFNKLHYYIWINTGNVLGISEELFVKYTSLVDSLNVEINTKEK